MKLFTDDRWYRGNLHTHTTVSDGRRTPEETIAAYRAKGYDFLAITDHRIFGAGREEPDFVLIPGAEYDLNDFDRREAFHILGLGIRENVTTRNDLPPQQLIDGIRAAGGMAVLAHPGWSLLEHASAQALTGYEAMEIYNGVSEFYSGRGYYGDFVDTLASKGRVYPLLANDDTHFYELDFASGWTMLQTDSFTISGILDSLRAGRYYSTQGPEIHQITLEDGRLTVETSPLTEICFYSDAFYAEGRVVRAQEGETLTTASYQFGPLDHWVRIEGRDASGKRCFSNYIIP